MISQVRFDRPDCGYRFTHDVLWNGEVIGQASEVRAAINDPPYSWLAYAAFYESHRSLQAIFSDDVEQAVTKWCPRASQSDFHVAGCVTAQPVALRCICAGGAIELLQRRTPTPIPGVEAPLHMNDLRLRKLVMPQVVAW